MKIIFVKCLYKRIRACLPCEATDSETECKLEMLKEVTYNKFRDNWYFLVFCPLNKTYDAKFLAFDHIRLKACRHKDCSYVITREQSATKVHWNLLINTEEDLSLLEDAHTNKFFIHYDKVSADSVPRILRYITKEMNSSWKLYNDYSFKNVFNFLNILYD